MRQAKNYFILTPVFLIAFVVVFSLSFSSVPKGDIDGYVFPQEAKPYVEISIMNANGDTVTKKAHPNAQGYFKFNNIPIGGYTLEYWPKNPIYISKSKNINVIANTTVFADTVRLTHP